MVTQSRYRLTPRLLRTMVIAIIWMGLPAGILFILRGASIGGGVLLIITLVMIVLSFDGRVLKTLENRRLSLSRVIFIIISWLNSAIIVSIFLFVSTRTYLGNLVFILVYSVGLLILLTLCACYLISSREKIE